MRGAWDVVEPVSGARIEAFPGVAGARDPLAWFDSLEVGKGNASWLGYESALTMVRAARAAHDLPRTRAMFHLLDGDFGLDETGLKIERGDSLRWLTAGAHSANRGARGAIGQNGRHTWGAQGGARVGPHRLDAAVAQRGAAAQLAGGEEQTLRAAAGRLGYGFRSSRLRVAVSAARGLGSGESFLPRYDVDVWSRRDAQRNELALEAGGSFGERDLGFRLEWSESRVARSRAPEFVARARALWLAGRTSRPLGEGVLELGLGAGHHDALEGWDLAPGLDYRFVAAPFYGRIGLERLLAPVWADLAAFERPFLQSTWAASWELGVERAGLAAELGAMLGTSNGRAVVSRPPLEEQWLRAGFLRDSGRYDFGLLTAAARWDAWKVTADMSGFALGRARNDIQPAVDPPFGGRIALDLRFRMFQKELDVALGPELLGVGPRESEATPARHIDGYLSLGVVGTFTLGDATLTVRARNLEDRARPETWIDSATGREAIGVGRELRIGFVWKLFN